MQNARVMFGLFVDAPVSARPFVPSAMQQSWFQPAGRGTWAGTSAETVLVLWHRAQAVVDQVTAGEHGHRAVKADVLLDHARVCGEFPPTHLQAKAKVEGASNVRRVEERRLDTLRARRPICAGCR